MRFIRVFLAICVFFLAVIFVVQNSEFLGQTTQFKLDLFVTGARQTIPLPLYFVILAAFLLGGFAAIFFLLCDRIRLGFKLGSAKRKIKRLERELTSLRALPLATSGNQILSEEKFDPAALPPFSPQASDSGDDKPANPATSI